MIGKVAKYYQTLLNRFTSQQQDVFHHLAQHPIRGKHLIFGHGTAIYHMCNKSYYRIIDDDGNKYLPINSEDYQHILKNNSRIQFCLQIYPDVSNIHQWGETSLIVALKIEQ